MVISFSEHARRQLKERGVAALQVKRVVSKPDGLDPQEGDKHRAVGLVKKNGKSYLLVVIYRLTSKNEIRVITAFLTSKIKKYL